MEILLSNRDYVLCIAVVDAMGALVLFHVSGVSCWCVGENQLAFGFRLTLFYEKLFGILSQE